MNDCARFVPILLARLSALGSTGLQCTAVGTTVELVALCQGHNAITYPPYPDNVLQPDGLVSTGCLLEEQVGRDNGDVYHSYTSMQL